MLTPAHFQVFLDKLDKVKPSGEKTGQYMTLCPAHDDKSRSLAVKLGDDDKILVSCFYGCSTRQVVDAMGLKMKDLFPPQSDAEKERYRILRQAQKRRQTVDDLRLYLLMMIEDIKHNRDEIPEDRITKDRTLQQSKYYHELNDLVREVKQLQKKAAK